MDAGSLVADTAAAAPTKAIANTRARVITPLQRGRGLNLHIDTF